jgi:hypothetical protein
MRFLSDDARWAAHARRLRWALATALLGWLGMAPSASAHVRWFTPDPNRDLDHAAVASGVTLLALAAIAATIGGAWMAQRAVTRLRLAARARVLAGPLLDRLELGLPRPADVYPWIAAVLALHAAAILFVRGVERQLFTPNMALPYTLAGGGLALLEIVVAVALVGGIVVGALTRPAAVGLALLGLLGMRYFGPLLVIEHGYFFGIAACLFIAGRGPGATERVLRGPGKPSVALLPYAIPALRVSFGLATVVTGFTEKLWDRGLALDFLATHPFNVTAATPFPVTDARFAIGAGLAEVSLGALLLVGLFPRLAILAAWVPFNLAVPFLGTADVLGHLPIYGILLTILLCGSGASFAATLRRETAPQGRSAVGGRQSTVVTPAPLPQLAGALGVAPDRLERTP